MALTCPWKVKNMTWLDLIVGKSTCSKSLETRRSTTCSPRFRVILSRGHWAAFKWSLSGFGRFRSRSLMTTVLTIGAWSSAVQLQSHLCEESDWAFSTNNFRYAASGVPPERMGEAEMDIRFPSNKSLICWICWWHSVNVTAPSNGIPMILKTFARGCGNTQLTTLG